MNRKLSLKVIAASVPVLIVTVLMLLPRAKTTTQADQQQAYRQRILTNWASYKITSIDDSPAFIEDAQRTVRSLPSYGILTPNQGRSLEESVLGLLFAYHKGNYESFAAFRFPIDPRKHGLFKPQAMEVLAARLPSKETYQKVASAAKFEPFYDRSSPEKVVETYWKFFGQHATIEKSKQKACCTDCWKGIALDSLSVEVQDLSTQPTPLRSYVGTNAVAGGYAPPPLLEFRPTVGELLARNQQVRVVYVRFVVHTDQDVNRYPIYVNFYWAEDHDKWIPLEFCAAMNHPTVRYIY